MTARRGGAEPSRWVSVAVRDNGQARIEGTAAGLRSVAMLLLQAIDTGSAAARVGDGEVTVYLAARAKT